MANTRNTKFKFGFLNNAQDPADLNNTEATICDTLDADKLALGTLQVSSYGTDTLKTWDTATVAGRDFRLSSGVLQWDKTGSGSWSVVNNNSYPVKLSAPPVTSTSALDITVTDATVGLGVTMSVRETPGVSYSGANSEEYTVRLVAGPSTTTTISYKRRSETTYTVVVTDDTSSINTGIWYTFIDNLQVSFTGGSLPDGTTTGTFDAENVMFPDGSYSYLQVAIESTGHTPAIEVESLPSDSSSIVIANFDGAGTQVASLAPLVTIATPSGGAEDTWLYRKGPDDSSFFRVATYLEDGAAYTDTRYLSSIVSIKILESEDDEGFADINAAIGNGSNTYSKLYAKDNRLWLVPTGRQDLVLYSRHDFWGWSRDNSFAFDGDVTDIEFAKDTTAVGGEFTAVFFTDEGIFHITGNGTEQFPYRLVTAVKGVNVRANSVVDMNGLIMLTTVSTDTSYDAGAYGQKVYEYDLSKLIEVSARVQNSDSIIGGGAVTYAAMRGSDKYLLQRATSPASDALVYHRDAQGWVSYNTTNEAALNWVWQSKDFTPDFLERFKIGYARMFKVVYVGEISIEFTIYGAGATDNTVVTSSPPLIAGIYHGEYTQRLPAVLGRRWKMKITGTNGGILYDFYFVR